MLKLTDNILVFTDLDGSLLSHENYQWHAASTWLSRLDDAGIPVIMTTSKTAAEVDLLWQQTGLTHCPFIAENGAQIVFPANWHTAPRLFGCDYNKLCTTLNEVRAAGHFPFSGFADVDNITVARWTGLSPDAAHLARKRVATEPLYWQGDEQQRLSFQLALAKQGLSLSRGGRFWHVSGEQVSKGNAACWLTHHYQQRHHRQYLTLGLGDAPNDLSFLQRMDYAVLIHNPAVEALALPAKTASHVYRTRHPGPLGWREGMDYFFNTVPNGGCHE